MELVEVPPVKEETTFKVTVLPETPAAAGKLKLALPEEPAGMFPTLTGRGVEVVANPSLAEVIWVLLAAR